MFVVHLINWLASIGSTKRHNASDDQKISPYDAGGGKLSEKPVACAPWFLHFYILSTRPVTYDNYICSKAHLYH